VAKNGQLRKSCFKRTDGAARVGRGYANRILNILQNDTFVKYWDYNRISPYPHFLVIRNWRLVIGD